MKLATTAILTAISLVGAASAAATIDLYSGAGCSDTKTQIMVDGCVNLAADFVASASQNIGDNGIKYTCNAYGDDQCQDKLAEVYHCADGAIGSINCYENPPL